MEYFELGYVNKTVGNKGEISIILDTDQPAYYSNLTTIFLDIKGTLVPYMIDSVKIQGSKAVVKLQDINGVELANLLIGSVVKLPLEALPKLKGDQFYFHEIIGFDVIDKNHGNIGKIESIIDQTSQAIFQIQFSDKEILIPISDDILKKIDKKNKVIHIEAPEGLIEIYID